MEIQVNLAGAAAIIGSVSVIVGSITGLFAFRSGKKTSGETTSMKDFILFLQSYLNEQKAINEEFRQTLGQISNTLMSAQNLHQLRFETIVATLGRIEGKDCP